MTRLHPKSFWFSRSGARKFTFLGEANEAGLGTTLWESVPQINTFSLLSLKYKYTFLAPTNWLEWPLQYTIYSDFILTWLSLPLTHTFFFICTNKDLVLLYERGIEGETSLEIDLNPNPASVKFLLNYLSSWALFSHL